jgi:hypothetical protein
MKFNYAPGMPGYGTRGIDGSTGLTGLSTYFSQYDGNTETSFIKSKIQNNKILFSVDQALPDGRIYWTGDVFIDRNGNVFEIDLSLSNLYIFSGISLNVSGYFEVLKNSPYYSFQRLSNRYSTNPILIDVVYTDPGTGDYTTYPTSIYSNSPADFAQVKYDDKSIAGYYPFEVWTVGSAVDDDAIALVKESINNYWHLGNKNGATVKNATLYLDFKQTFIESSSTNIAGNVNIVGGIQVTNPAYFSDDFYIGGELRVENGTWLRQNVAIGGKLAIDSDISTYGSAFIGNDIMILGNLAIGGKLAVNSDISIGGNIKLAGTLEVDSISNLLGYTGIGTASTPAYPLEVTPGLTTNFTSSSFSGSQVVGRIGDGTTTIDDNYLPPYAMIGGSFISSYIGQNFDNIGVFGFAEGTNNSEVTAGGLFSANQTGSSKAVGVYIRTVTGSTTYGIYQLGGASNYFASPITIESATAGLPLIADANKVITTENAADFRTRIGLGNSATEDIGTTAGTVCAGDDSRLSDSRQCNNYFDNATSSRFNLGLGNSAVTDVGTTSGTVAAGNDPRITGAVQTSSFSFLSLQLTALYGTFTMNTNNCTFMKINHLGVINGDLFCTVGASNISSFNFSTTSLSSSGYISNYCLGFLNAGTVLTHCVLEWNGAGFYISKGDGSNFGANQVWVFEFQSVIPVS